MVSLPGSLNIKTMFMAAKATQAGTRSRLASKAVANVADRLDHLGVQLAAKPSYVDVDDVAAWVEGVAPHIGKQLLTTAHLVDPTHQVPEQSELAVRQLDGPLLDLEGAAGKVKTKGPHL